jgi:hypothetical protein
VWTQKFLCHYFWSACDLTDTYLNVWKREKSKKEVAAQDSANLAKASICAVFPDHTAWLSKMQNPDFTGQGSTNPCVCVCMVLVWGG